jgi:uncharacterized protein
MKFFILALIIFISSCVTNLKMSNQKTFALRLKPAQDLKKELVNFVKDNNLQAAYIITCVGSLKKAALRLANQQNATTWEQKFEIVSLVGTMSAINGVHLHVSISDSTGYTIGGHLVDDNIVYTTAEIVIGEMDDKLFSRKVDSATTYKELFIEPRSPKNK